MSLCGLCKSFGHTTKECPRFGNARSAVQPSWNRVIYTNPPRNGFHVLVDAVGEREYAISYCDFGSPTPVGKILSGENQLVIDTTSEHGGVDIEITYGQAVLSQDGTIDSSHKKRWVDVVAIATTRAGKPDYRSLSTIIDTAARSVVKIIDFVEH